MEKIIITTPGNIPTNTVKQLVAAGCIVIEAKEPEKVKTVSFSSDIFTHDLLMSALHQVTEDNNGTKLVKELNRRLKEKEVKHG